MEIIYSILKKKLNLNSDIIISKGHASMAYLACLEYYGHIKKINSYKYIKKNSKYWGHVTRDKKNRFFKFSFGSLGYGLGISVGLAYDNILKNKKGNIYCVISDGELNEGSTWEAIFFASHHKLNNLKIIIDNNKIQSFGYTKDILNINYIDLVKKMNFKVYSVEGHSINKLFKVFHKNEASASIIFCNTIKGKGIKQIENKVSSHYIPAEKRYLQEI